MRVVIFMEGGMVLSDKSKVLLMQVGYTGMVGH